MLANWKLKLLPLKSKADYLHKHGELIGEMNLDNIQKVIYLLGSRFYQVIYVNAELEGIVTFQDLDGLNNKMEGEFMEEFA